VSHGEAARGSISEDQHAAPQLVALTTLMEDEDPAKRPDAIAVACHCVFDRLAHHATQNAPAVEADAYPKVPWYWLNKTIDFGIQQHEAPMLQPPFMGVFGTTCCESPGCLKSNPLSRWHVRKAWRIENTWLWEAYSNKKMEIANRIAQKGIEFDIVDGLTRPAHHACRVREARPETA
jgi:hypothetical protein